jgi:hypothetical protein
MTGESVHPASSHRPVMTGYRQIGMVLVIGFLARNGNGGDATPTVLKFGSGGRQGVKNQPRQVSGRQNTTGTISPKIPPALRGDFAIRSHFKRGGQGRG